MSVFRMSFAAPITKVDHKEVGGKALVEASLCKKNRAKEGQGPTFSWLRVSIWSPPDWMAAKLVKGAMLAGTGEFTLRSYEKDGQKRQSAEVNCQSFDVEVSGGATDAAPGAEAPAAAAPKRPAPVAAAGDDEPPF